MLKLAALIWIILGTALAGSLVITVLAMPSLAVQGLKLIPVAAGSGFLVAIPFAILIAKKIYTATAARS